MGIKVKFVRGKWYLYVNYHGVRKTSALLFENPPDDSGVVETLVDLERTVSVNPAVAVSPRRSEFGWP